MESGHNMRRSTTKIGFLVWLSCALAVTATGAYGKAKHGKNSSAAEQDGIEVIARLPLEAGAPVTKLTETQHYGGAYLYAEHDGSRVTLIDINNPRKPMLKGDVNLPSGESVRLVSATGYSVLTQDVANEKSAPVIAPQTFRIMSFADPAHPAVKQEFNGVTAMASDPKRDLLFLVNGDGLWVLHQTFAKSPRQEDLEQSILHSIYDTR